MKNEPLFSIAIPTYNRLSFLRRALESALSQTYQNIEIIVLDNASTDGTYEYLLEMAKQYSHIKVITNAGNIGFVKNVQQIPDHTHGKYLNVLSDDDYLDIEFCNTVAIALEKESDVTLWYCRASYIDKIEKKLLEYF